MTRDRESFVQSGKAGLCTFIAQIGAIFVQDAFSAQKSTGRVVALVHKSGIFSCPEVRTRIAVCLEIVGTIVVEVAHKGGIIADALGNGGVKALIVKHALRHLSIFDQLANGMGDDDHNSSAPLFCIGWHGMFLKYSLEYSTF
jgi:hypothetical protein